MKLSDLPALGQPLAEGIFTGLTTKRDGTHHAVVLLPTSPEKRLSWQDAMAWAKGIEAELPTRPVAALLYADAKPQFEEAWYWTADEENGSCAWNQGFDGGLQGNDRKSYEGRARAVRLIQLTA